MSDSIPFAGASSDWLSITQAAFRDGRSYFDSGVRRQIEQDVRQFQGLHPTDSKYVSDAYKARSRFFRPKTRATIRKNEAVAAAAFFSNTDIVEISAWDDSDQFQQAAAELQKELLQLRLKRHIPWFHIAIGGYQEAQAVGLVCAHTYWKTDKKKGIDQPWIDLIPIENMVFSPASSWFDVANTSPYLIRMVPMFVKDVLARMNTVPGKTEAAKWFKLPEATLLQGVTSFSDSIRLAREHQRADAQAQPTSLLPYQTVWVYETIADIDGEDYIWHTLGESQLLSPGKPLVKAHWHGRRPYVIGYSVLETHKIYPPGVARLTRELQAELNENANQRSDNVKFAMNKRYFGKRGAMLDIRSLTRNIPSSVTLMNDPELDVKVLETKDVTQSAYEEQDRLNIDFDEIAGSNSKPSTSDRGDLANKVGGQEILTEDQNQIEGYQLRTYTETFIEPLLRQVMLLEQHYETDQDILKLCATKANIQKYGETEVGDDLLMQELSLTIHVGIGSTSPRKQLENLLYGFNQIKLLLETPTLSQYGLDVEAMMNEIFGKLGYRTAERFFKWDNQDPSIVALNNQVQQLTDALKNKKDPPEITAGKVLLLAAQVKKTLSEAFNVNVEGLFGSMQAAEVVAAVPAVAPVADTIAKAAGYEEPSPPGIDPGIEQAGAPSQDAGGAPPPSSGASGISPPVGAGALPVSPTASMGSGSTAVAGAGAESPASGLSIDPKGITNRKTGVNFHPGGAGVGDNGVGAAHTSPPGPAGSLVKPGLPSGTPHNTDPLHPALPSHPDVGTHSGIEGGANTAMVAPASAHPSRPLAGGPPAQSITGEEDPAVARDVEHQNELEMLKLKQKHEIELLGKKHKLAKEMATHTAKEKKRFAPPKAKPAAKKS